MPPHYLLGIDFGTSSLRIHRSVLKDDGELDVQPQSVTLKGSDEGGLPMVIELEPGSGEVRLYGKPALSKLVSAGEGAENFVLEFKPCLGQAQEDLASQGKPAVALVRVCQHCDRACSPDSAFCPKGGKPLPPVEEASAEVLFRYSQDQAFEWFRGLLERVAQELTEKVYAQAISDDNG